MTNQEIATIFDEIYNQFWSKYRDKKLGRDSLEWGEINAEVGELLKRFPSPLAHHMVLDLLDELENRCRKEPDQSQ